MSKPWDCVRVVSKSPIGIGNWYTSRMGAGIKIVRWGVGGKSVLLDMGRQYYGATDLLELSEFCAELAEQLGTA